MQSPKFSHFIITRFNLKQSVWNKDKSGQVVNDLEWLKERYDLFENYCFPSLKAQSVQDFKWLVYFDLDTPEHYKLKNKLLSQEYFNFIPLYVENFLEFESKLSDDIRVYQDSTNEYIITTRIDNDDCFHFDAVKIIQGHFVPKNRTIIDLCKGLCLQIYKPVKLTTVLKHSGPFISLISLVQKGTFETVYDREHTAWIDLAHYIPVKEDYLWLQLIHKRNVSNMVKGTATFNRKLLNGYPCIKSEVKFGVVYYLILILKKYLRKIYRSEIRL